MNPNSMRRKILKSIAIGFLVSIASNALVNLWICSTIDSDTILRQTVSANIEQIAFAQSEKTPPIFRIVGANLFVFGGGLVFVYDDVHNLLRTFEKYNDLSVSFLQSEKSQDFGREVLRAGIGSTMDKNKFFATSALEIRTGFPFFQQRGICFYGAIDLNSGKYINSPDRTDYDVFHLRPSKWSSSVSLLNSSMPIPIGIVYQGLVGNILFYILLVSGIYFIFSYWVRRSWARQKKCIHCGYQKAAPICSECGLT